MRKSDPWAASCFTRDELAQLRADDARLDDGVASPARVVWRDRPACPRCGALRFRVNTTKTDRAAHVTRYCTCSRCAWSWRLIDLAPAK